MDFECESDRATERCVPEPSGACSGAALASALLALLCATPASAAARLGFVENRGQMQPAAVRFAAAVPGARVWIEPGVVATEIAAGERRAVIRERVAPAASHPAGVELARARVHDLRGDPARWRRDVPTWHVVSPGAPARGVSLRVEARGERIEKIFTVAPGARPESIAIDVEGATSLAIETDGALAIATPVGALRFSKPVAWQEIRGRRVDVPVRYALAGSHRYGFRVGSFDRAQPLVIDPQLLLASTYAGELGYDYGMGIDVAANGDVYVAGDSKRDPTRPSSTYPTTAGAFQTAHAADGDLYDVVVSRFSSDLTELLASTFVGGSGQDYASVLEIVPGLTEGAPERILVSGTTGSADFPTTPGAYDTTHGGGSDVFVLALTPDLSALTASTFFGGSSAENASEDYAVKRVAFAVAPDQTIFLAGTTYSNDLPTTPGAVQVHKESDEDAFVARLSADLGTLLAATYLGGDHDDSAYAIAVSESSVWVGGETKSGSYYDTDAVFPSTPGAFQEEFHKSGGVILEDGFVTRFDHGLTTIEASTYLGDDRQDSVHVMARSPVTGAVYVAGVTQSSDFPVTPGAVDTAGGLAFVSGLSADLTTLVASSFFGGTGWAVMRGLRVDSGGDVWLTGYTTADDLPVTEDALYPEPGYARDVFVSRLDALLATVKSSTYVPGHGWEEAYDLRVHEGGWSLGGAQMVAPGDPTVLLTGYSESSTSAADSFPTTPDAYDRIARNDDLFATVIGFPAPEPDGIACAVAALASLALVSRPAARACGAR